MKAVSQISPQAKQENCEQILPLVSEAEWIRMEREFILVFLTQKYGPHKNYEELFSFVQGATHVDVDHRGSILAEGLYEQYKVEVSAVHWAVLAYKAWYCALVARKLDKPAFASDAGEKVVWSLVGRFISNANAAVKYVKDQTCYLSAFAFGQEMKELPSVACERTWLFSATKGLTQEGHMELPGIFGPGWIYTCCKAIMLRRLPRLSEKKVSMKHGDLFQIDGCCINPECGSGVYEGWIGLSGNHLKELQIGSDILMSKTGRGRVPDSFIDSTIKEHWETLTREHVKGDSELISQVCRKADEIVRIVFLGKTLSANLPIPSQNASARESVEELGSRQDGGCFGKLLNDFVEFICQREGNLIDPEVVSIPFDLHPISGTDFRTYGSVAVPAVGLDLVQEFNNWLENRLRDVVGARKIRACPLAIPEPDKVRIITAMEAEAAYATLCIQKMMHSAVKAFPVFEYMGHPIDEVSWSNHFSSLRDNEVFLSGDYKGATDNLDPDVSRSIWTSICRCVKTIGGERLSETIWADLGEQCLTEHLMCSKGGEKSKQVWGQLMGSPMSFPILCIANAAACMVAFDMKAESIRNERTSLVVNGDDVAAIMDVDKYPFWCKVVSAIGMKPSLGKNYVSRSFLIMNSEVRWTEGLDYGKDLWGHRVDKVSWSKQGFLNQALLFSTERKGQDAGTDLRMNTDYWDLGDRARELISDVPIRVAKVWLTTFLVHHKKILEGIPVGVSKYFSKELGGAGIPYILRDRPIELIDRQNAAVLTTLGGITYPKRDRSSLLNEVLTRSEEYYKLYLPKITQRRDEMDVLLENWGYTVQREKSSLGAFFRLGFVLNFFVQKRLIMNNNGPKCDVSKKLGGIFGMGAITHTFQSEIRVLRAFDYRNFNQTRIGRTSEDKSFSFRVKKLLGKLSTLCYQAKKRVCNHDGSTIGTECPICQTDGIKNKLHPMLLENIVSWKYQEEEIIPWEDLGVVVKGCRLFNDSYRSLYDSAMDLPEENNNSDI